MESQSNQVQEYTLEDIFTRGVTQEDLSIQSIQNELHQTEIINEEFKLNPFYISLNGGNLSKLKKYPFSQDVIVYYPLNSSYDENIHHRTIKKDYVFKQDFSYMRVSQNILNISHHKFRSQLVSKEDLNKLLFKNDDFNLTEIVVGLFELSLNDVQQYLLKYKSFIDFNQIMKISDLNKLYNVRTNLSKDILNLKHANYWTIPHNCMINLTENFTQREFQSKPPQVIKLSQYTTVTPEGDSPMYPTSGTTRSKFHDMSMVLRSKHNNRQLFYSTPKAKLDRNVILNFYNSLQSDRDKYSLLNSLLISKDYCDLIVNNKDILLSAYNLFEQYKGCFKYTMGYAWLSLSCEESLKLTSTTKLDRFVFDIETASKLPKFPFLKSNPKLNPYFTLCVNDSELTFNNQLPYISDYDGYGVCDLATFKHRLNIFISGDCKKDIFTGLNWASYAVTGSLIPACLPKKSPLLDQIEKNMQTLDKDIAFKSYIDTYYPDSDIDIMSNESSTYKFIDRVQELYEKILSNLGMTSEACQYEIFKTSAISLTERFFEGTLNDFNQKYKLEWDISMYEANLNDLRVRYYLYDKYVQNKLKINQQIILTNLNNFNSNRFLRDFMEITPFEKITFYYVKTSSYKFYTPRDTDLIIMTDLSELSDPSDPSDKNAYMNIQMKISEGIRFKMSFKGLSKPIEIFQSHKKDFFSVVAKFHLGCVRAYYQDTVYMLPSCISAMMIGLNMDYKYVHGIKNPIQIIMKYEKRGFGTILNKTEAIGYAAYNEVNSDKKIVSSNTFISNTFISNIDEFKKLYPNKVIDHSQISHINSNGYPNNVSKSFIDFVYENN
jgi:hypothetical protein